MPITRETYQITATDLNGLILRLNSILSRVSDRLDKLEGLRDELETASGTFSGDVVVSGGVKVNDSKGERVHSME